MEDSEGIYGFALPNGTVIDKYRITKVLGQGGFGITYLAIDESLGKRVAIKECFPSDVSSRPDGVTVAPLSEKKKSDFDWALKRFVEEAQILAKFEHPNIVSVTDVFHSSGTAYMATAFINGMSFDAWLAESGGRVPEQLLIQVFVRILSGLKLVHSEEVLHRDIKPENIYIDTHGQPVLLDFGSARQAVTNKSMPVTSVVSPGYAPFEQYFEDGNQGPWTDLYALGAVMYHAVTGTAPPEATRRERNDSYQPCAETHAGSYSREFLETVDSLLSQQEKGRPQSVDELYQSWSGSAFWSPYIGGVTIVNPVVSESSRGTSVDDSRNERDPVAIKRFLIPFIVLVSLILVSLLAWFMFASDEGQNPEIHTADSPRNDVRSVPTEVNTRSSPSEVSAPRDAVEEGSVAERNPIREIFADGNISAFEFTQYRREIFELADGGDVPAMRAIYKHLEAYEPEVALKYAEMAAEAGDSEMALLAGQRHAKSNRNYSRALSLWKLINENSEYYSEAATLIGECYFKGLGVRKNSSAAVEFFEKASKGGSAEAFVNLGIIYYKGDGVRGDYAKAYNSFREAEDLGAASALFNLGVLYMNGHGVAQNIRTGADYFRRGAIQGNQAAINAYAKCLANGHGVPQNIQESERWLQKLTN